MGEITILPSNTNMSAPAAAPKAKMAAAIKGLGDKKGSSRQAILKYVVANNKVDAAKEPKAKKAKKVKKPKAKKVKKAKKPAAKKAKKPKKAAKKPAAKKPAAKKAAKKPAAKKAAKKAAPKKK